MSDPYLRDADVTLYKGDVLDVLRDLPAESVDCCVTSPPYWGLRDYGTGAWESGDPDCDHQDAMHTSDPVPPRFRQCQTCGRMAQTRWIDAHTVEVFCAEHGATIHPDALSESGTWVLESQSGMNERLRRHVNLCRLCGATRIDQQLGLEATPEEYVTRMVEVFREVRRVLAAHGTVWLNLGDSYASSPPGNTTKGVSAKSTLHGVNDESGRYRETLSQSVQTKRNTVVGDLKPKDLVGIPWRVAFALQADGWYLRSDIIWAKPNPMPESVTDRPTKAHEYVFLLSKQPRYFFDQEAVREANTQGSVERFGKNGALSYPVKWDGQEFSLAAARSRMDKVDVSAGRNVRSVWEIATQPYPEAHFATFPEELARRCIAAGCPEQVCRVCGKARERVVVATGADNKRDREDVGDWIKHKGGNADGKRSLSGATYKPQRAATDDLTDCGHGDYRPGLTLDPFIGSGSVAHVARKLGRHAVGIDLNESYLELAARRLQQQSLFADIS